MNKQYHIIGLMSGTSLDGLDIVKCTFKKEVNWSFQLEIFETIKYSEKWRNTLKSLHLKNENETKDINKVYGKFIGEKVKEFIKKYNVHANYISSL